MQARGGEEVTLNKGETFFRIASRRFTLSGETRAETEPAKFLAFFVKDKGAPVVLPAK